MALNLPFKRRNERPPNAEIVVLSNIQLQESNGVEGGENRRESNAGMRRIYPAAAARFSG